MTPQRRVSLPLVAGYAGLAAFFALEATVRGQGSPASLRATDEDRGTTRAIVRAFALGACLPLLPGPPTSSRLPRRIAWLGLAMEAGGLAVRAWSMRTLGDAYTRTLQTGERQQVVERGPYRFVRHPGYLGTLLAWTGFALTSRSLPVVGLVAVVFGRTYARRIVVEERLLARALPGYREYATRTRRLIPFAW